MSAVVRERGQPRPLDPDEIDELLAGDHVCRMATVDKDGFPHVTPIWFLWSGDCFRMTSRPEKSHLARLARNPRAGLVVDIETEERADGERPNRQVRVIGQAELGRDVGGLWTRRITEKYVRGQGRQASAEFRSSHERIVICLRPDSLVAVASR